MQAAEYPQKKCREAVFNDSGMGYTCELPLMHPGPCASFSVSASVTRRNHWEDNNEGWEKNIGNLDIEV